MKPKKESTIFGQRLQELMDEHSMTNERLGDICGVERKSVIHWKYEDAGPRLRELIAMARFFDVSIDYLAGLTNLRKGGQMTRTYFNEKWED